MSDPNGGIEWGGSISPNETFTMIGCKTEERTDPPPDEWPYPTEWVTYAIAGELGKRIRNAAGMGEDTNVIIEEEAVSGGYSEYTQETDYTFEVRCGSFTKSFTGYRGLHDMLKWLEESENDR